jgi:hypothetical protein
LWTKRYSKIVNDARNAYRCSKATAAIRSKKEALLLSNQNRSREKLSKPGTGRGHFALVAAKDGKHKARFSTFSLPGKEKERS